MYLLAPALPPGSSAFPSSVNIAQFGGSAVTLGQKTMASSMPVVIASDQSTFPVTVTFPATIAVTQSTSPWVISGTVTANAGTNLNTSLLALESGGNLATLAGGVSASVYQSNVKQINGITPLMGNGITGTGSLRVTIASDNTAFAVNATLSAETTKVIGTVNQGTSPWVVAGNKTNNNAAPGATNVGALTVLANAAAPTWIEGNLALLSADLSGNLRVILTTGSAVIGHVITDAGSVTKLPPSATATLSNVAGSASSVTLLALNTNRLGATIVNDSTAQLYVKFGSTASATSYVYTLFQFDTLEVPFGYTGIITGIWASATGNARVTEFTT